MVVASVLRHSDPNLTMRRYAHMDPAYLRQELNKLFFAPASWQQPPEVQRARAGGGARGDGLLAVCRSLAARRPEALKHEGR